MEPQQQGGMQLPPLPQKSGDTYSYKGWLISDSFIKRAFAVLGYNMVAGLMLYIPFVVIFFFLMGSMFAAYSPGMMQHDRMDGNMMQMMPPPGGDMPMPGMSDPMMSGKIDINAVCNAAIISMTFENGAAADAFVQECIDGQHPEVIEQYMQEMRDVNGIDSAII